jgi:DNA-binding response OmpR family regulator
MPDAQRLDLIVLDVNLPRSSGELVLREIRAQPSLVGIPVIMLTSSPSPDDKAMAAKMGADLFIQKSSDLDQFFEVGKIIEHLLTGKTR